MFKLEFDPANKQLATAIGTALVQYGIGDVKMPTSDDVTVSGDTELDVRKTGKHPALGAPYGDSASTSAVDDQHAPDPNVEEVEPTTPAADAPTDEHGVPHNDKYCVGVKAKQPFYQSGPNKGQWKRGKGVDESEYNEWYTAAMPEDSLPPAQPDEPVNTGAAFGGQTQASAPPATQEQSGGFANTGELFHWITEMQSAGKLTNDDVNTAYSATGVTVGQLFDQNNPESAKQALDKLANDLLPRVKG